jgi:hypothetical protein
MGTHATGLRWNLDVHPARIFHFHQRHISGARLMAHGPYQTAFMVRKLQGAYSSIISFLVFFVTIYFHINNRHINNRHIIICLQVRFKHIYLSSIARQVLASYMNHFRVRFLEPTSTRVIWRNIGRDQTPHSDYLPWQNCNHCLHMMMKVTWPNVEIQMKISTVA